MYCSPMLKLATQYGLHDLLSKGLYIYINFVNKYFDHFTITNTNSFIDNQIALTGSINQHKISYND